MKALVKYRAFVKYQIRDGYGDVHYDAGDKVRVTNVPKKPGDEQPWFTNGHWTFPRSALTIPRKKKK